MPRILGLEPEQYRPLLYVGGGLLVVLLLLKGKGSPAVASSAPTGEQPSGFVGAPGAVASEVSAGQSEAERIALDMQQEELAHTRELHGIETANALTQQKVFAGEGALEEAYLKRQRDVVMTKPVSCPHGSEVRLGPDGRPYCRSSKGATNLRNVVVTPAAEGIKKAIPQAIEAYIKGLEAGA